MRAQKPPNARRFYIDWMLQILIDASNAASLVATWSEVKCIAFSLWPIKRVIEVGTSGLTQRFSAVKRPKYFEVVTLSGLVIAAISSGDPDFGKIIAFLSTSITISKILLEAFKKALTSEHAGTVILKKVVFFRLFFGSILACLGGRTSFFPFK